MKFELMKFLIDAQILDPTSAIAPPTAPRPSPILSMMVEPIERAADPMEPMMPRILPGSDEIASHTPDTPLDTVSLIHDHADPAASLMPPQTPERVSPIARPTI